MDLVGGEGEAVVEEGDDRPADEHGDGDPQLGRPAVHFTGRDRKLGSKLCIANLNMSESPYTGNLSSPAFSVSPVGSSRSAVSLTPFLAAAVSIIFLAASCTGTVSRIGGCISDCACVTFLFAVCDEPPGRLRDKEPDDGSYGDHGRHTSLERLPLRQTLEPLNM